jgi:tRNA (adenine22-N1)-methyltransferase
MAFSERLKTVSSMISKGEIMADIGTDHGYVPIYAIRHGIMKKVIAADISRGSCDKAQANINANGFAEQIEVRCGNGLEVIRDGEVLDCLLISGMGGLLAIEIMKQNIPLIEKLKQLVVQPQRDIDAVRKFVHAHGFKIVDEDMLFEDGKYYTVLNCERGEEGEYSPCEYMFGKRLIEKKSAVLREYCMFENNKIKKILESVQNNGTGDNSGRIEEIQNKQKLYEEVLECLWSVKK